MIIILVSLPCWSILSCFWSTSAGIHTPCCQHPGGDHLQSSLSIHRESAGRIQDISSLRRFDGTGNSDIPCRWHLWENKAKLKEKWISVPTPLPVALKLKSFNSDLFISWSIFGIFTTISQSFSADFSLYLYMDT